MIKVYTTKTCAYCKMVKQMLDKLGKSYMSVDLDDDPVLRQQLLNKTGAMTVPITENNGSYVVGWQPAKLMELVRNES